MRKQTNLTNFLYRATCVIMIFLFACTYFQTLGTLSHMPVISASLKGLWKPVFLLSGSALLFLLIAKLTKLLLRFSEKKQAITLLVLGCMGLGLQLAFLLLLRPCLQYDALKPVDTAMSLLKGIPLPLSDNYEYFSIYPHNLPLTLYIMCIFKVAQFLGIPEANYILILQLCNIIFLDLALFQLYRLVRRKAGMRASVLFALLCLLNPLLYYYPVFFYTQVLSIPIFVLLITVFFRLLDETNARRRILYGLSFGIVMFFAWKIRFFTLITLIAMAMYLFFFKNRTDFTRKAIAITLLSTLISFFCCLAVHNILAEKYSIHTEKEYSFPIHHWIMMGLQGDGTFYYIDEDFSKAFLTRESRIEANKEMIARRIQELGPDGLVKLWGRKLAITWADGYDDYSSNLNLVRHYGQFYDWICGYRSEFLAAWLHIYNSMSWLLLTICALRLFRKKLPDFTYAICITIVGGMVFHLFWEAGEQYSMPFALLIIAAAAMGADSFLTQEEKWCTSNNFSSSLMKWGPPVLLLSATLIHTIPDTHTQATNAVQPAAIQNLVSGEAIFLKQDQVLRQTVTCSSPVNTLTLRYKYYGDQPENVCIRLRLSDGKGNILTEQLLPLEKFFQIFEFSFPETTPDGEETFLIELSGISIPDNEYLGFAAYNTGNWDTFPNGCVSLDEEALPNSDLYFELSNHSEKTLF